MLSDDEASTKSCFAPTIKTTPKRVTLNPRETNRNSCRNLSRTKRNRGHTYTAFLLSGMDAWPRV